VKKIIHCRACGSKALSPAFSMSTGGGAKLFRQNGEANYVLCDPSRDARACGLLQLSSETPANNAPPSGRRRSNRDHLRAVATEALELISGRDCAALDIGCNDGSLLSYYPRWVDRFGVDPSSVVEDIGEWAWTAKAVFPSQEVDRALGDKKFDIITAVSVIEHLDDPRAMIARVKALLTDDGVFVLETLYAPMILTRNAVDAFQSGVATLYSLSVLEWMLREAGLKIFRGSLTEKQGGSVRLYITHIDVDEYDFDPWSERLARLWDEENALAMRALQPYQSFEQRIGGVHKSFVEMLEEIAARGENAHILGADLQVERLLQWAGPAAKVVTAAVDTAAARERNHLGDKGLRIISETDCRTAEPDFLIAPARYKQEVLETWRESILLGARMIFVTPTPHVVTASNYATEFGKQIAGGDGVGGVETLRSILSAVGGPRLISDNKDRQAAG